MRLAYILSRQTQLYGRAEDAPSNGRRSLWRKWNVAEGVNFLTAGCLWTRPSMQFCVWMSQMFYLVISIYGHVQSFIFSAFVK